MLVLSRRVGEEIVIGEGPDQIVVAVIEVLHSRERGPRVKLGVTAPRHVPVHRREVYEQVKGEGRP